MFSKLCARPTIQFFNNSIIQHMAHFEPPMHWNDHEDVAMALYEKFGDDDFEDIFEPNHQSTTEVSKGVEELQVTDEDRKEKLRRGFLNIGQPLYRAKAPVDEIKKEDQTSQDASSSS